MHSAHSLLLESEQGVKGTRRFNSGVVTVMQLINMISCQIGDGNGADISKHCVPPCLLRGLEEGRTVGCQVMEF
ncbi:hypothetical protein Droror1_Dr00004609 [Drosera rotundifolia]